MRGNNFGIVIVVATTLLLSGCLRMSVDRIQSAEMGGEAYTQALAEHYRAFSKQEAELADWADANYFAEKGLRAAKGVEVEPEHPEEWEVPEGLYPTLREARRSLMDMLNSSVFETNPRIAAKAVFLYDCWLEQQEEKWQENEVVACKDEFYSTLDTIRMIRGKDYESRVAEIVPDPEETNEAEEYVEDMKVDRQPVIPSATVAPEGKATVTTETLKTNRGEEIRVTEVILQRRQVEEEADMPVEVTEKQDGAAESSGGTSEMQGVRAIDEKTEEEGKVERLRQAPPTGGAEVQRYDIYFSKGSDKAVLPSSLEALGKAISALRDGGKKALLLVPSSDNVGQDSRLKVVRGALEAAGVEAGRLSTMPLVEAGNEKQTTQGQPVVIIIP